MQLEQRDKQLAAVGASIGCNCRPCVEHHVAAGRDAGLSDAELADAVATARAVRNEAIGLLVARIDELLGGAGAPVETVAVGEDSRVGRLVAIGASVGANTRVAAPPDCRRPRARTQPWRGQGGGQDGDLCPATRERDDGGECEACARRAVGVGRWRCGSEEVTREVETCTSHKRFRWPIHGCTAAGAGGG
jgi:AhpD family alkylhydroperoxidase